MIINLPENLESFIRGAVESGQFASVDEAMTEAARLLQRQLHPLQPAPQADSALGEACKPIWEPYPGKIGRHSR